MMKLSNDITILAMALTIQKLYSSEKYSCKSPRFNAAYSMSAEFKPSTFYELCVKMIAFLALPSLDCNSSPNGSSTSLNTQN